MPISDKIPGERVHFQHVQKGDFCICDIHISRRDVICGASRNSPTSRSSANN